MPAAALDRASGVPLYRQLADDLRRRIQTGEWAPGSSLPSEAVLCHEYDLGRDAVRRAVYALRDEGRLTTQSGRQAQVVAVPDRKEVVILPPGSSIDVRMPTWEEREKHKIPHNVPVAEVHHSGRIYLYPADRYRFVSRRVSDHGQ